MERKTTWRKFKLWICRNSNFNKPIDCQTIRDTGTSSNTFRKQAKTGLTSFGKIQSSLVENTRIGNTFSKSVTTHLQNGFTQLDCSEYLMKIWGIKKYLKKTNGFVKNYQFLQFFFFQNSKNKVMDINLIFVKHWLVWDWV